MNNPRIIETGVYILVIVLSVIAIWLVLNAPAPYLNVHAVYQGF